MRYSQEVKDYIKANVEGKTTLELVDMVNAKFGTDLTTSKMKSYKQNHGFKSGNTGGIISGSPTKLYPQEIKEFITNNYKGAGPKKLTELINQTFGSSYARTQISAYCKNNKLDSGTTGHYKKGNQPMRPFQKGIRRSVKTEFKEGTVPHNWVPIGTERIHCEGYIQVKVDEGKKQKNWKMKHIIIWEEVNGKVPEGHVLIFADGNRSNLDINNLLLISRKKLFIMNRKKLIKDDVELTKSGVIIAGIYEKIYEKRK